MENWKDLYAFVILDKDKKQHINQMTLELDVRECRKKYKKLIYWAILTL